MASGSIGMSSNQPKANGRIDWQSYPNQAGNYSDVNAQVYVVLSGYGIQQTGAGQWKENGNIANTFSPTVNIAWGGSGTVQVFSKNGIRVNHDEAGNGSIVLGCDMQFAAAGVSNIGGSDRAYMDHIARYANFTQHYVKSKTINTVTIHWEANAYCDAAHYSINGGAWTGIHGSWFPDYTITGLQPNTTYSIRTRIKRTDSQLWTESSPVTVTTFNFATITEAPNIIIGQNPTIKYNNPAGASVKAGIYKTDGTTSIIPYETIANGTHTFNFTEEKNNELYDLIPNASKIVLRYYIQTIQNGITYTQYVERDFSVDIEESKPIFDFSVSSMPYTYSDINTVTSSLTNSIPPYFILNYSNLRFLLFYEATAQKGASITSYRFTDGTTSITTDSPPDIVTINKLQNNVIDIYAIDSRGLSSKQQVILNIIDYTPPIIDTNTILKRVNGVESSVYFNFNGYFWNKNFGEKNNSIKSFKYKKILSTSNNWDSASWIDIPNTKYSIDSNGKITNVEDAILPNFEVGDEFKVKIRIEDELDFAEIETNVSSGEPILAINKTKKVVGVGKLADKTLPVGSMDLKGMLVANGIKNSGLLSSQGYNSEMELGKIQTFLTPFAYSTDSKTTGILLVSMGTVKPQVSTKFIVNGFLQVNDIETEFEVSFYSTNVTITNVKCKIENNNWLKDIYVCKNDTGLVLGLVHTYDDTTGSSDEWNKIALFIEEVKTSFGIINTNQMVNWNATNVTKFEEFGITTKIKATQTENGTVLYHSDAGTVSTVILNDTVANYKYIKVFYAYTGSRYNSGEIYNANNKFVNMVGGIANQNGGVYLAITNAKIVDKTITPVYYGEFDITGQGWAQKQNVMYIYRVVGYKN